MTAIQGYRDLTEIYSSARSAVYRGRRSVDDLPVVLKILNKEYPAPEEILHYRNEYEVLSLLRDTAGSIKALGLERIENSLAILLEDCGADSLRKHLAGKKLTLEEALRIGIGVAGCLQEIHGRNVIHRDINPENILYHPTTRAVRLIDFGNAALSGAEPTEAGLANAFEGTLAYTSPEQTGRMNRSVDFRTDFYSLGITLYELLCGQLPFTAQDPMELIHCHIARSPTPPHLQNPAIPGPLSQLVLKLMAKTAEQRYKSAHGIKVDLETCLFDWLASGKISPFPLGARDVSARLQITDKLYGREAELERLTAQFALTCQGQKQLTWIADGPGMGKTALAQAFGKASLTSGATFICGKFLELTRNTPYSGLLDAFRQLTKRILTESESHIARIREELLSRLGRNAQIIIDLIPEMEWILGSQPEAEPLPPVETKNRFRITLQQFMQVITSQDHPLFIFLDDLQWADSASLNLLQLLLCTPEIQHLLLLGAYREGEVTAAHPLAALASALETAGVSAERIVLSPLSKAGIQALLAQSLCAAEESLGALAEVIRDKTSGNPLLVHEFLYSLEREGSLCFEAAHGAWVWDLVRIRAQGITDSIATLMESRIQTLDPETQKLLEVASCIGEVFSMGIVTRLVSRSPAEIERSLRAAVEAGLLLQVEFDSRGEPGAGAEPAGEAQDLAGGARYRFIHGRIQQAAYALLSEEEKQRLHLGIGRLLLSAYPPEDDDAKLFDIVANLIRARGLIDEEGERDRIAHLLLLAGKKAKTSTAYEPALRYLSAGIEFLGKSCFARRPELSLLLHEEAAEASYLSSDFPRMEALTARVLVEARTTLEKAKCVKIRIEAQAARDDPRGAIRTGLGLLKEFGFSLPEHPRRIHLLLGLLRVKLSLARNDLEGLINLPQMSDPGLQAAIQTMRSLSVPAFVSNPSLMALLLFVQVRLAMKHGHTRFSGSVFASFGIILCGVVQDIETGYRSGQLAIQLTGKFRARELECRTVFLVNTFIRHWKEHLESVLEALQQAYQLGLETGDFEYAAFSAHVRCQYSYFLCRNLEELESEMSESSTAIRRLNQRIPLEYNEVFHQAVLNLQGKSPDPCALTGAAFQEDGINPGLLQQDRTRIFTIYFLKLNLCCLFQRYKDAVQHADFIRQQGELAPGMFGPTRVCFYDSLARLKVFRHGSAGEQRLILRLVQGNQKRLKKWADHAPQNHLHLHQLIEAERARIRGERAEAIELYEKAIELARVAGYRSEEALAHELAGDFFLEAGMPKTARAFLREAYNGYSSLGAKAKVLHLERTTDIGAARKPSPTTTLLSASPFTITSSLISSSLTNKRTDLDLYAAIKASQSISSQIVIKDLLDQLMKIVIETAGAERVLLILEKDEVLRIEAEMSLRGAGPSIQEPVLLESYEGLSQSIVRYVSRTREPLILGDASNEGNFVHDPYVMSTRARSILCTPLVSKGEVTGFIYLENNQTTDAFTAERVEVLTVLAGQAAISIDNAHLYRKLELALVETRESARVKTDFLARTSHELKTPLNSVINLPEILIERFALKRSALCASCGDLFELELEDAVSKKTACPTCHVKGSLATRERHFYQGEPEEMYDFLKIVASSGRYLLNVVNDVLDMSKLEAGRVTLHKTRIQLRPFLENLSRVIAHLATQARLTVTLPEVPDGEALVVDPLRLQQILLNLVTNAIKFSSEGTTVRMDFQAEPDRVRFSIRDQGIGIPREQQAKIFESFYQVESGATRRGSGTGLGLTITRQLVELHEGRIWFESEVGQGSTFYVELPRAAGDNPEGEST